MEDLRKRFTRAYNISPPLWKPPSWEPAKVHECLDAMRAYVEADVESAIHWYWAKKPWKAWASQTLKFLTLVATGLGGLMPIITATGVLAGDTAGTQGEVMRNLRINQVGYLCFGLAAAFLAFDKYFGYSTGWMRYITTAMALETALRNFRLDWARTTSGLAGAVPSGAVLEALLEKLQDFCIGARTLVEKETQAWVMEFQSNLSQLEQQAKAAIDSARAEVATAQKLAQTASDSARPGAIDLTVGNVLETDHGYSVSIDEAPRKDGVTSRTCALLNVSPGLHELAVTATISGAPAHDAQTVSVSAGASTKVSIVLAKAKSVAW